MSDELDILNSNRVKVFAVLESTPGTLAYPAAADFICPAGDATLKQVPTKNDSAEKADTLDVINQFSAAMPPAEWAIPMYLRMAGFGSAPQGDVLLKALQGSKQAAGAVTAAINDVAGIDDTDTEIPYDTLAGGELPPVGVITIGTEKIRYGAKNATTLLSCERGYGGTTAAGAVDGAVITLSSPLYKQAVTSPSFSLWIMTDWFMQFAKGCSVGNGSIAIRKGDAVKFDLRGQGMQMGWCGQTTLDGAAAEGATSPTLVNAKMITVGARIQNVTQGDTNSGSGYEVTAVDVSSNTMTISPAVPAGGWASGDVIRGYLPDATPIGTAVLGDKAVVRIGGVVGKIRSTDLTIDVSKKYIDDEVGDDYPSQFLSNKRKVSTNMDCYFRKSEASKFYDGFNQEETTLEIVLGQTAGYKASLYMGRVKTSVPTVQVVAPAVALQIPATALGTLGEDSFYLGLE